MVYDAWDGGQLQLNMFSLDDSFRRDGNRRNRWSSRWCVDSQAIFASVVASVVECLIVCDLRFNLHNSLSKLKNGISTCCLAKKYEKKVCRHKSQKKKNCWKCEQEKKFVVEIDKKYVYQKNHQMVTYIIGKAYDKKYIFHLFDET